MVMGESVQSCMIHSSLQTSNKVIQLFKYIFKKMRAFGA